MTEFTQVATIPKTARRCKAEGIGLTENQLRTLLRPRRAETTPDGQESPDLLAQPVGAAGKRHPAGGKALGYGEIRKINA